MILQRCAGACLVFVATFFGGGIAAQPEIFINIPSLTTTFGVILGGIMFSGRSLDNLVSINWKKAKSDDLIYSSDTYRYLGALGIGGGVIGTLIGWILMLANLENPEMIGMGLSISLLTVFYGVTLKYLVCDPIAVRLKDRAFRDHSADGREY